MTPPSCIGALLRTITYGTKTDPVGDPYISLAEKVIQDLADAAIPVSMIFDAMPSLIPIVRPFMSKVVPFNKSQKEWVELAVQFRDVPFKNVQNLVVRIFFPQLIASNYGTDFELRVIL